MSSPVTTVKFFSLFIAALALAGCGSSKNVASASCSRCGATVTAALCAEWGSAAGCQQSHFVAGTGSACDGCSFSDCDAPPSCDATASLPGDAGRSSDSGAPDPACAAADPNHDGLFSSTPPCSSPHTVQINGATSYTCPCGSCPCGYQCGSITLSVGGVISSVCAPP